MERKILGSCESQSFSVKWKKENCDLHESFAKKNKHNEKLLFETHARKSALHLVLRRR